MTDEITKKVYELMETNGIRWIALQFTDLLGGFKQVFIKRRESVEWLEKLFEYGVGKLDGSSVKGFQDISESDMLLKPDPTTFAIIPWTEQPTARFICDVLFRDKFYPKDPRSNLNKAVEKVMEDYQPYMGVEVEFFIFRDIEVVHDEDSLFFSVNLKSEELPINEGMTPYDWKTGYYVEHSLDTTFSFRERLIGILESNFNMVIESHHHEVGIAGQSEINVRYGEPVATADNFMTLKYVAKTLGNEMGFKPIFMPKPIPIDNGSGLHMHISLFKDDRNIFYDENDEYAFLSQTARYFIGGLLHHGRALSALVSPTVNSYRRLIPGYEAPVYLVWSRANRSAAVRVPYYTKRGSSGRIEYRPPDPSCNPYIALAGVLAAGMDGIKKKIDPGDPIDEDVYKMDLKRRSQLGIKTLPRDLWEALDELESDREFLKGYLEDELINQYIELKRAEYINLVKYASSAEYKLYSKV